MRRHALIWLWVLLSIPARAGEWKLVWSEGQKGVDASLFPHRYSID